MRWKQKKDAKNNKMNKKTKKYVCFLCQIQRKWFSNQWQCKKKVHCVVSFLVLFWCVWVSFFFADWVNGFLRAETLSQIISKIKAKTKTKTPTNFQELSERFKKERFSHIVQHNTTVSPLSQKERKMYFLSSIVVVGNKINMVCVCVCVGLMWWLFQPNKSIYNSRADWKILRQAHALFWCDFWICRK